jgi:hypothetical protein
MRLFPAAGSRCNTLKGWDSLKEFYVLIKIQENGRMTDKVKRPVVAAGFTKPCSSSETLLTGLGCCNQPVVYSYRLVAAKGLGSVEAGILQPEAAVIFIEKPVYAGALIAQDITLFGKNLFAHGKAYALNLKLAEKPLSLIASFNPYLYLALIVMPELMISDMHFLSTYKLEAVYFKMCIHNYSVPTF